MTPEEINRLIAEKCMGWHEFAYHPTSLQSPTAIHNWLNSEDHVVMRVKDFDPYHNISHAMMALEKFRRNNPEYFIELKFYPIGEIACVIHTRVTIKNWIACEEADTPSAAISLAIVEAVKK